MREDQAKLPWCRKGGVMVSVDNLGEEGFGWPSASSPSAGSNFLLWSGKGHDKVAASKGSSMLGDAWIATTERTDSSLMGDVSFADWKRVPLDPSASPDGRWKSNGDVLPGYFVAFGGDDSHGFLNDLWVLPLAHALGVAGSSDNATSTINDGEKGASEEGATTAQVEGGVPDESSTKPTAVNSNEQAMVGWGQPQLQKDSELPHVRRGHTVTVLPSSRLLVVVGGRKKHEVCLHDAWVLPLPKGELATPRGETEGLGWDQSAWVEIEGVPGECRWGHAATHATDPITMTEFVAIFGGRKFVGPSGLDDQSPELLTSYDYNNELWLLSVTPGTETTANGGASTSAVTATWSLAATGDGPVPVKRDHHSLSYDASSNVVYLFGGRTSPDMSAPDAALHDLWKYSLGSQSWTQLHPVGKSPDSRYLHMAAFASSQLVVFGGEHIDSPGSSKADHKLNDLWSYSVPDNAWHLLSKNDCECTTATNMRLSAGLVNEYMWSCLIVGTFFALWMVWFNHRASRGGGDKVFDYCRPRIQTPAERAAAASAAASKSNGGKSSAPHVVVEMAGDLASKAVGSANRKKGYQAIN